MLNRLPIPQALTTDWIPPELLARDEQLALIRKNLKTWGHIYLSGGKGLGKTLLCKIIGTNGDENFIYITCANPLKQSIYTYLKSQDIHAPKKSLAEQLQALKRFIPFTLIVDDLQKLYHWQTELNFFHTLYENLGDQSFRTLIASTISFQRFERGCPDDVMSRYIWRPITLPRYSLSELYSITKQRIGAVWGKWKSEYDTPTQFIADKANRFGDPRIAIRILRETWSNNPKAFTTKGVEEGWKSEKKRYWTEILTSTGSVHTGILLYMAAKIAYDKKQKGGEMIFYSNNLYRLYEHFCKDKGSEPLSFDSRRRELTRLEREGYLDEIQIVKNPKGIKGHGIQVQYEFTFDEPASIVVAGDEVDWELCLSGYTYRNR